jgi:hypothetical protein
MILIINYFFAAKKFMKQNKFINIFLFDVDKQVNIK